MQSGRRSAGTNALKHAPLSADGIRQAGGSDMGHKALGRKGREGRGWGVALTPRFHFEVLGLVLARHLKMPTIC